MTASMCPGRFVRCTVLYSHHAFCVICAVFLASVFGSDGAIVVILAATDCVESERFFTVFFGAHASGGKLEIQVLSQYSNQSQRTSPITLEHLFFNLQLPCLRI